MSEQIQLAGMPAKRPTLSEAELLSCVIDTARVFGWRVAHFRPSQTKHGWKTAVQGDGKGFPDLILVRDTVLAVELKVGGNTLSSEQAEWLEAFRVAGTDAHVWTDADWFSGEIEARLRRSSGEVPA